MVADVILGTFQREVGFGWEVLRRSFVAVLGVGQGGSFEHPTLPRDVHLVGYARANRTGGPDSGEREPLARHGDVAEHGGEQRVWLVEVLLHSEDSNTPLRGRAAVDGVSFLEGILHEAVDAFLVWLPRSLGWKGCSAPASFIDGEGRLVCQLSTSWHNGRARSLFAFFGRSSPSTLVVLHRLNGRPNGSKYFLIGQRDVSPARWAGKFRFLVGLLSNIIGWFLLLYGKGERRK